MNRRLLGPATLTRLKKASILIGSCRVRKQRSEKAADLVDGDEEEWDLVYDLLPPNKVAIADDTVALQQFGEAIFCAPQEDILEGGYVTILLRLFQVSFRKLQISTSSLAANASASLFKRITKYRRRFMGTKQRKKFGP